MNDAALPFGLGVKIRDALDQAETGVGDDELDAFQAALLQMTQKAAPSGFIFLGAF